MAARSWFDKRAPPCAATSTTLAVDAGSLWHPGLTETMHYPHAAVQAREAHGQVSAYATASLYRAHRHRAYPTTSERGACGRPARSTILPPPRGEDESTISPSPTRPTLNPQSLPPRPLLAAGSPVPIRSMSVANTPLPPRPSLRSGWTPRVAENIAPGLAPSSTNAEVMVPEYTTQPRVQETVIVKSETISAPPVGTRISETWFSTSHTTPTSLSTRSRNIHKTRCTTQDVSLLGHGQASPRMPTSFAPRDDVSRCDNDDVFAPASSDTASSPSHNDSSDELVASPHDATGSMLVNVSKDAHGPSSLSDPPSSPSAVLVQVSQAERGEHIQGLSICPTQPGLSEPGVSEAPDVKYPGYVWVQGPKPPSKVIDVVAILPRCTRSGRLF
jgi:hypothetical protein